MVGINSSTIAAQLLSSTSGISSNVLASWYASKEGQSTAAASGSSSSAGLAKLAGVTTDPKALPPWDPRVTQPSTDAQLRSALGGQPVINESAVQLSSPDASATDQKMFTLYNGLAKLKAIADDAANRSTASYLIPSLGNTFSTDLSQVLDYASTISGSDVVIVPGKKTSAMSAGITVPFALDQYSTKTVQNGLPSDPVAGLNGTEKFTIAVTKGGTTTNVPIDLSTLGTSTPSLNDVVSLINSQLSADGFVTRFKVQRNYTPDANGNAPVPLPETWGIGIQGVGSEQISFSAATAGTAVYATGNSGGYDATTAQFLKLDASGSTSTLLDGARVEANAPPAKSSTTSSTSTTSNPSSTDEQAIIANIQAIAAKALAGTASTAAPPTTAGGSAIDSQGNVYMVGTTKGSIGDQTIQGSSDVYLTKYDSTGHVVWQRMLGAAGSAKGLAVAVDPSGNVVVAGSTTTELNGNSGTPGNTNSFVTKFDSKGQELFTRDVGSYANDSANALTIGSDGSIYYGGVTSGPIGNGATYGGGTDGYVTKLSSDGTFQYSREIGGSGNERITSMALDSSGNLVTLSMQDGHAVVTAYSSADGTSAPLWQTDLGNLQGGNAAALSIDGGNIYVGGSTATASVGGGTTLGTYNGGTDGFVAELNSSGAAQSTTFVGSSASASVTAVKAVGGQVYVGGTTEGDLGPGTFSGSRDGFTAKLDGSGGLSDVYQFSGRNGQADVTSLQVDTSGSSVLDTLGLPKGTLSYPENTATSVTAESTVRPGQQFSVVVNGGAKRTITIGATDTLSDLAFKLNQVLVLDGQASVSFVKGGTTLQIKPRGTSTIQILPGPDGNNALPGLGLSEGTIVNDTSSSSSSSSSSSGSSSSTGPIYVGLDLQHTLTINSRTDAQNVSKLLDNAMLSLRTTYTRLHAPPPSKTLGSNNGGTVPAYLQAQLANYQTGLQRLLAGSGSSSTIA